MFVFDRADRRGFFKRVGLAAASLGFPPAAVASSAQSSQATDGVRAVNFESRPIYHSSEKPGYACWVSFFPGECGQWYLTCEQLTEPPKRYPRMSIAQTYMWGLPTGYDTASLKMDIIMLESRNDMKTWDVISRQPVRFQHSAGSFGQARTKDGRFLRFVWESYSLEKDFDPGRILYVSNDDGKSWQLQPKFHDRRFYSYPHRLRTLRDGTFVLALPMGSPWGPGTDRPVRTCINLNAISDFAMHLCFSYDQGNTWTLPMPIYAGNMVSETDFTELPSGDLLCINNSIFANPGRQIIYRTRRGFVPGPFERSYSKVVPETIALTEDGLLIGCLRNSHYFWSDDLGLTWNSLEGIPERIAQGKETYQPWIQYLGSGRFANAGHYGGDYFYGEADQYVMIHFFGIEVLRKTKNTRLDLVREFDEGKSRWRNTYDLRLTCEGQPLAGQEIEFWYVENGKPGYDSFGKVPLNDRMKVGGEIIRIRTGADGIAHVVIPRLDVITNIHQSVQMVARFNMDRREPYYKPAQTPQFEFYSNATY